MPVKVQGFQKIPVKPTVVSLLTDRSLLRHTSASPIAILISTSPMVGKCIPRNKFDKLNEFLKAMRAVLF